MDYYLILLHATLGSVALILGTLILFTKKGHALHKTIGKGFTYSLTGSVILSLVVSVLPGHFNPFLFTIGFFTLYLLWGGIRLFKSNISGKNLSRLKIINGLFIIGFVIMTLSSIRNLPSILIVQLVFGIFGLVLSARAQSYLLKNNISKSNSLSLHIGYMSGAYIASVSAFLVVNDVMSALLNWFLPTILGTLVIIFFNKKYAKLKVVVLILCISTIDTFAQSEHQSIYTEYTAAIGFSGINIKDQRFSAIAKQAFAPVFGGEIVKSRHQSIASHRFYFTSSKTAKSDGWLLIKNLRPYYQFTYNWKIDEMNFFGFNIENLTLLNTPVSRKGIYTNNPISYLTSLSVGPSFFYRNNMKSGDNSHLYFVTSIQAALLGYVIHPAYGHPYPKSYLKPGTFHPERKNMTSSVLKSGNIVTINRYNSINISFGLQWFISDKYGVGVNLKNYWHSANFNNKLIRYKSHDILFSFTYKHIK
ncbi:MAG: hypothetical protein R2774_08120 [Saprospiraceae bacterium]